MKKIGCFSVAIFTSITMFISAGLSFRFKTQLVGAAQEAEACFIMLQGFLLLKYVACTLILMPGKISFNQLALGFLTADLMAATAGIFYGSYLVLPIPIVTMQIIMIAAYRSFGNKHVLTISTYKISQLKKGLLTEGV